jgi:adenylate cyclase
VAGQVARPLEQLAAEAEAIGRLEIEPRPPRRSVVTEVDRLAVATEEMKAGLRSFQRYVPADLVRSLLASGQEARPGGERRQMTISFCDIVNFTAIAEWRRPEDLVQELGEYFDALSAQVCATGGTVDKYMGDAVMAFWGAPAVNPRHALAACTAAIRCQQVMRELRRKWAAQGRSLFHGRVGLGTGEVIVGNIGSPARLNYTVIGDAANLASRLEGLNKYYGTEILISSSTYEEAKDEVWARPVDWVSVKGKTEVVLVYELLGLRDETEQADRELAELYTQALRRYRQREWTEAIRLFEQVLQIRAEDGPARQMLARCRYYQGNAPGEAWDGVHRMESK